MGDYIQCLHFRRILALFSAIYSDKILHVTSQTKRCSFIYNSIPAKISVSIVSGFGCQDHQILVVP